MPADYHIVWVSLFAFVIATVTGAGMACRDEGGRAGADAESVDIDESEDGETGAGPVDGGGGEVGDTLEDRGATDTDAADVRDGSAGEAGPNVDTRVDTCLRDCSPEPCEPEPPDNWPESFEMAPYNPVVLPTISADSEGADNIYAPDIVYRRGGSIMFYGGRSASGHDQIFAATSQDGLAWRKYPHGDRPEPVLRRGNSNHVNDPSVVRVRDRWWMYYTDAATGAGDRIGLAVTASATSFEKLSPALLEPGPAGSWEADKVGRPSVIYEDGTFKMWYDGQVDGRRHVGYAESTDGMEFAKHPANPVLRDAGAVDVERVGDVYVMVFEAPDGTHWAISDDGICWAKRGLLIDKSGREYDAHGHVTPHLEVEDGNLEAIWFGAATAESREKNRIAVAYPEGKVTEAGGCTECMPSGRTCVDQCQVTDAGETGVCAEPGSTTPGNCCRCSESPCSSCLAPGYDCYDACLIVGTLGGHCEYPGSSSPGRCCICYD